MRAALTSLLLVPSLAFGQTPPAEGEQTVPDEVQPAPPVDPPTVTAPSTAPAFVFADTPPEESDADCWIKLVSGEWLKAEMKTLRHGDLIIDSDKLGDQTISFDDVEAFWVPRSHIFVNEERETLVGPAKFQDDVLTVRTDAGVQTLTREQLTSIVQGAGKEIHLWSFKADLGADMRIGNSEQLTATANARVTREGAVVRYTLGYGGSVGFADNLENVHWHKGDTKLDTFLNSVFYLTPLSAELYYDKFQNIAARTMAGAGLGFRWEASGKVTWTGYSGGIFQNTRYIQNLDTGENSFIGGGVSLRTGFIFEPNGDLDITLDWMTNLILNDLGQTSHEGIFNIEYELSGAFDIFVRTVYTRIETPPTSEDGVTPKSDDAQFIVGLSVSI